MACAEPGVEPKHTDRGRGAEGDDGGDRRRGPTQEHARGDEGEQQRAEPSQEALLERGRLVWYEPWQAWIMTRMDDIMACWKTEPLSSDFYDWEFAPKRPPEDEWTNFERALIGQWFLAGALMP